MAQITQTSTRFYVGITDVESSVKCVQKREYSRNIDTYYGDIQLIQKKAREKVIHRTTHTHRIVVFIGLALMMPNLFCSIINHSDPIIFMLQINKVSIFLVPRENKNFIKADYIRKKFLSF